MNISEHAAMLSRWRQHQFVQPMGHDLATIVTVCAIQIVPYQLSYLCT